MKTANFSYKAKHGTLYGKVTLKDDQKVSISLHNSQCFTGLDRAMAKKLANDIVKAEFKHDAATNVEELNTDKGLIAELLDKTKGFKAKYITATKEWAKRRFEALEIANGYSKEQWAEKYDVEYEIKDYHGQPGMSYKHYDKKYYKMLNAIESAYKIVEAGFEKFEVKAVLDAERHYKSATDRLAYRLRNKGVTDGSKFEITACEVGVNLEITIKHDEQITRAFTIVAEGEINRAHYRYLVH